MVVLSLSTTSMHEKYIAKLEANRQALGWIDRLGYRITSKHQNKPISELQRIPTTIKSIPLRNIACPVAFMCARGVDSDKSSQ